MADHFKRLYQGQPIASDALLYVVPSPANVVCRHAEFINIDNASSDTITLWILPLGESVVADEWLWTPGPITLAAREKLVFDGVLCLDTGDQIWGETGTGGIINGLITGGEFT